MRCPNCHSEFPKADGNPLEPLMVRSSENDRFISNRSMSKEVNHQIKML